MFKLGCYTEDGEMEVLATAYNEEDAKKKYIALHEEYKCTIWIQKIQFVTFNEL